MGKRDKFKRTRDERNGGLTLLIIGACLLLPALLHSGVAGLQKGTALGGLICAGLGAIALLRALPFGKSLPKKEVMRLAESRNGILTLSETATALDIDPTLAEKTLKALSKMGIATQRHGRTTAKTSGNSPTTSSSPSLRNPRPRQKEKAAESPSTTSSPPAKASKPPPRLSTPSPKKASPSRGPDHHLPRFVILNTP